MAQGWRFTVTSYCPIITTSLHLPPSLDYVFFYVVNETVNLLTTENVVGTYALDLDDRRAPETELKIDCCFIIIVKVPH